MRAQRGGTGEGDTEAAGNAASLGHDDTILSHRGQEPVNPHGVTSVPVPSGVHAVLTQADSVVGTPAYMAPEQAAGKAVDARTDQYALAATLLDALLGQSPVRRVIPPSAEPRLIDAGLERAAIAPEVRSAVIRALAEEPARRFPAIDELLAALAPPGPRRSRRALAAGAGVALCGAAAVLWLALGKRAPEACTARAPGEWLGEPRTRVVAALSSVPRAFSAWDAARIGRAIDGAVETLGAAEIARCQGAPIAGPPGTAECIARRITALGAAVSALAASPPPDDPWRLVRAIEQCDPADSQRAEQRAELRRASPERARAIGETARSAGDDALAADAFETAGLAALAAGDTQAAERDLVAMSSAGERAGNDAARGRALLHLIEVARWRGDHAAARRSASDLQAMLARNRTGASSRGDVPVPSRPAEPSDSPHRASRRANESGEELTVALAEAAAFTDLGDVAATFTAWERARAIATARKDPSAALAAAAGHAWSTYALRLDLAAARTEIASALGQGAAATAAARADALAIAADLAILARDGSAARAALDEAHQLVPARAVELDDQLRMRRARALDGELDTVLPDVPAPDPSDPLTPARYAIARGEILLAADHASEARGVFERIERDLGLPKPGARSLPFAEHFELVLASCEAQLATEEECKSTFRLDALVKGLHPRAPARARVAIIEASSDASERYRSVRSRQLTLALDILVEAAAEPLQLADLRWRLAQLGYGNIDHRALAQQARDVFAARDRPADVAAIDRWLSGDTGSGSGDSPESAPDAP